ncbi:MAG: hypothetical protein LUC41_02245 [Clostridiales bacterium]|nr:hypothetical protein [Clostridiales bacterium]
MRKLLKVMVYCLLVLAIAVGLGLPTVVGYFQDRQTDETIKTVSANSVQLNLGSSTTLLMKYRMIGEDDSPVKLDSARKMDGDQALEQLMMGLDVLFSGNEEEMGEIPYTAEGFSELNHNIYLKIDGEDSLIYWDFLLEDKTGDRINAVVDDDTGVILYLKYTLKTDSDENQPEIFDLLTRPPLFLNQVIEYDSGDIFSENGIFGNLEDTGYSAEEFTEALQKEYCDTYLHRKGYNFNWDVSDSTYSGSSYLYSAMLVNNEGGYYVLTFSVSNNDIIINP